MSISLESLCRLFQRGKLSGVKTKKELRMQLGKEKKTYGLDRRNFMQYVASISAISSPVLSADRTVNNRPRFKDNPFQLGVASGDPLPNGVVLWTKLASNPLEGGGLPNEAVPVAWEVATDEAFTKIVQRGSTLAMPEIGHSVHVEIDGLKPFHWYFYRFHTGKETSPVGRTRTAPHPSDDTERVRFAFTSCQHFESGYFNGYPHMQKEDLDLVVHLGDYIYEYKGVDNRPRKHIGQEIKSLD